jgi:hypothetical protein
MNDETASASAFVRAHELADRFPVLGRSTWNAILTRGDVPSRKIGRARLVRLLDVERFLAGQSAVGRAT